jgi:DNA-binding CsgD family transcriptional regulator
MACGRAEPAARLLGAEEALRQTIGAPPWPVEQAAYERAATEAWQRLGEAAFAAAWTAGQALSLDNAIRLAEEVLIFAKRESTETTPSIGGLTPREREVLCLLAPGRTYPQIAETLFLSPATVRTHVQHVYAKLDVASRLEAAAYARALDLC